MDGAFICLLLVLIVLQSIVPLLSVWHNFCPILERIMIYMGTVEQFSDQELFACFVLLFGAVF